MTDMRKITAFVPADLLARAQEQTGAGVSETLRLALERLSRENFYDRLRQARGKIKLELDLDQLREDRAFNDDGTVS